MAKNKPAPIKDEAIVVSKEEAQDIMGQIAEIKEQVSELEEATAQQKSNQEAVDRAISKIQAICQEEGVEILGYLQIKDLAEYQATAKYKLTKEGASEEDTLIVKNIIIVKR